MINEASKKRIDLRVSTSSEVKLKQMLNSLPRNIYLRGEVKEYLREKIEARLKENKTK